MAWGFARIVKNEDALTGDNFDYNGTNSLYISFEKEWKFHWITNTTSKGSYELLNRNNRVLAKGETEPSRIHTVVLDQKLRRDMRFRFGSAGEAPFEVALRKPGADLRSTYRDVDSIFVVGDVHGQYDQLVNLLKRSGIINDDLAWIGGKAHLVFLGDLFDRGNAVTKVLWFIYSLEAQAEAAKGKVHLVLGNHEIMALTGDHRAYPR